MLHSRLSDRPAIGRMVIVVTIIMLIAVAAVVADVAGVFAPSSSSGTFSTTFSSSTTQSTTATTTSSTTTSTPTSTTSTPTTSTTSTTTTSSQPTSTTSHSTSTSSSSSSSTSSTGSVTIVTGQTTSVTATSTATTQFPSTLLTSTGEGSPSDGTTVGLFGESLAVGGTFLVVGAPNETSSSLVAAGNAYIYSTSSGTLLESLTSPAPQELGSFGWSVAVSGNLAIVGAPGENASGKLAAGHLYAYSATTGKLLNTLASPNAQ